MSDKMTIDEAYAGLTENNPHFTKGASRLNHYWKSRGFIEGYESRDAEVEELNNKLLEYSDIREREEWNSIWCWKEIDRLKQECEQLEMRLSVCRKADDEIIKLEAQNEKMRMVLYEILGTSVPEEIKFAVVEALKGE